MRFPNIIRGRSGVTRRAVPLGIGRKRNARPKNGRLLVAVVLGIAAMVGLTTINLRLIRHPAVLGKSCAGTDISSAAPNPVSPSKSHPEAAANSTHSDRPEMTFYRDLTSEDELPGSADNCDKSPASGSDSESGAQQKFEESGTARQRGENFARNKTVASAGAFPETPAERGSPAGAGTKTYTVQVGSFSHPAIAQQWAANWKARGYDVALRPVARPNTGVNYSLYLGKFRSEKEADELVKRLKAKEGISAFRLTVPH